MTASAAARSPRLLVKVLCFAFAVIAMRDRGGLRAVLLADERASDPQRRREHGVEPASLCWHRCQAATRTHASSDGARREPDAEGGGRHLLLRARQRARARAAAIDDRDGAGEAAADHGGSGAVGDRCARRRAGERWAEQGRLAGRRARELRVEENGAPVETVVLRNGHPYAATAVPLVLGRDVVGEFFLASPLDDAYAVNLASEARADIAILLDGRVIASSTPPSLRRALEGVALPLSGTIVLGRRRVRRPAAVVH